MYGSASGASALPSLAAGGWSHLQGHRGQLCCDDDGGCGSGRTVGCGGERGWDSGGDQRISTQTATSQGMHVCTYACTCMHAFVYMCGDPCINMVDSMNDFVGPLAQSKWGAENWHEEHMSLGDICHGRKLHRLPTAFGRCFSRLSQKGFSFTATSARIMQILIAGMVRSHMQVSLPALLLPCPCSVRGSRHASRCGCCYGTAIGPRPTPLPQAAQTLPALLPAATLAAATLAAMSLLPQHQALSSRHLWRG